MEKPISMSAWQHGPGRAGVDKRMRLEASIPLPDQPPDAVLVKVLYASLNPVDYKMHEIPLLSRLVPGLPATLGSDFVGRVVEPATTTNVSSSSSSPTRFEPGQLVIGKLRPLRSHGALGGYVVVRPTKKEPLVAVDEGATTTGGGGGGKVAELAGLGTAGTTALRSLRGLAPGSRVFINGGSGGTGMYGVQIAKQMGLFVVATCSGRNEAFVRGLGADEIIDYTKVGPTSGGGEGGGLPEALRQSAERAGGGKFDRIVDNVGGNADLYWKAAAYLAAGGKYVQVGMPVAAGSALGLLLMLCWPRVLGGGRHTVQVIAAPPVERDLAEVAGLLLDGKIHTEMKVFEMDKASDAVRELKTGRVTGKIVVKVSD